jgi:hypothetical protein
VRPVREDTKHVKKMSATTNVYSSSEPISSSSLPSSSSAIDTGSSYEYSGTPSDDSTSNKVPFDTNGLYDSKGKGKGKSRYEKLKGMKR